MVGEKPLVKRVRFDLGSSTPPLSPQDSNNSLSRRVAPVARVAIATPVRRQLRNNQQPNIKKLFNFSYQTVPEVCFTILKALSVLFFGVFLIPYAVYKDLNSEGASY